MWPGPKARQAGASDQGRLEQRAVCAGNMDFQLQTEGPCEHAEATEGLTGLPGKRGGCVGSMGMQ